MRGIDYASTKIDAGEEFGEATTEETEEAWNTAEKAVEGVGDAVDRPPKTCSATYSRRDR